MRINGVDITPSGGLRTLKDLLEQEGYALDRIAVEKNGEIVPKSAYATTYLQESDSIEIVSFVGGG